MIDGLGLYLALGGLVAIIDSPKVALEACPLTRFEQFLLFARITLSWPTYLIEDYLLWKDRDAD